MKLLLTSGGPRNDTLRNALKDLLGKPTADARYVFIPTAMHPERGNKDWVLRDMNDTFTMGWAHYDIVDVAAMASLDKAKWMPALEQADVIHVGGGNCFYLSYWMQKSGVMALLPELLKTKVYVGSSAGSMLLAQEYHADEQDGIWYDREYEEQSPPVEGSVDMARLVPFNIRPHFNAPKFTNITDEKLTEVAKLSKLPMYAIDDATAVQVVGDKITVVSEGEWKLYNG